ncbi:MAG: polysaccharide deacetylase family protein [Armatimonadetes bacterium]|nr:polysaccharide deacetylase family protein [Armatimonadota bacterium]
MSRIPILMYHKVAPRPAGSLVPHHYVSPKRFQAHVRALTRARFRAIRLEELDAEYENTDRVVNFSFDDGYENFATNALPVLRAAGMTATVFAVAELLGASNEWDTELGDVPERLMSSDGLRAATTMGIEIGSHSCTHKRLPTCDDDSMLHEVAQSKRILSAILGRDVPIFCYPYGAHDARVREAVRAAGYRAACGVGKGWNDKTTDQFQLKRVNVRSDTSGPLLFWKLLRQSRLR